MQVEEAQLIASGSGVARAAQLARVLNQAGALAVPITVPRQAGPGGLDGAGVRRAIFSLVCVFQNCLWTVLMNINEGLLEELEGSMLHQMTKQRKAMLPPSTG